MAKNASAPKLIDAFTNHLTKTEEYVSRLEKVFESMGLKTLGKKCDVLAGLLEEADGIIVETEVGDLRDATVISAAQKVEHYEIAIMVV